LGTVFDPRQQRVEIAGLLAISPGGPFEAVDIGAGHEGLAGPHEHDRGNRGIALRTLYGFGDRSRDTGTEGVYRRVVDGDHGDAVFDGGAYGCGHVNWPI